VGGNGTDGGWEPETKHKESSEQKVFRELYTTTSTLKSRASQVQFFKKMPVEPLPPPLDVSYSAGKSNASSTLFFASDLESHRLQKLVMEPAVEK
jgi:hypothetical protein